MNFQSHAARADQPANAAQAIEPDQMPESVQEATSQSIRTASIAMVRQKQGGWGVA